MPQFYFLSLRLLLSRHSNRLYSPSEGEDIQHGQQWTTRLHTEHTWFTQEFFWELTISKKKLMNSWQCITSLTSVIRTEEKDFLGISISCVIFDTLQSIATLKGLKFRGSQIFLIMNSIFLSFIQDFGQSKKIWWKFCCLCRLWIE